MVQGIRGVGIGAVQTVHLSRHREFYFKEQGIDIINQGVFHFLFSLRNATDL